MTVRRVMLVLLLCLIASQPASANLVVNGSFEAPAGPNGLQIMPQAQGTSPFVWEVGSGSGYGINIYNNQPQVTPAENGVQVMCFFAGRVDNYVSQVIPTVAGKFYDLTFWTKGWDNTPNGQINVEWLSGGVNKITGWSYNAVPGPWTKHTFSSIAAGNNDKIKFTLAQFSPAHVAIDDVQVNEFILSTVTIPEAKIRPLGSSVICSGKLTAVIGDSVYIESVDRTSGVRVDGTGQYGLTSSDQGKTVLVTGNTLKDPVNEERCIDATSVVLGTNLIVNGSFEAPAGPNGIQISPPGGGAFAWTVGLGTMGGINYGVNIYVGAAQPQAGLAIDGNQTMVFFAGRTDNYISQVVPTVAGKTYELSFWTKGWDNTPDGILNVEWLSGGVNKITDWSYNTVPDTWTKHTFSGIVAGTNDTIRFTLPYMSTHVVIDNVRVETPSEPILPLGMTNKTLGGGVFGGQAGVAGGAGLNNIGLLVRTSGKATRIDDSTFTITDGSGFSVKVVHPASSGAVLSDDYVCVTGISSCEKDTSGLIQRKLIMDDNAKIHLVSIADSGSSQAWIVQLSSDPRVGYGVGRLKGQLEAGGKTVTVTGTVDPNRDGLLFIVGPKSHPTISGHLTSAELASLELTTDEGFLTQRIPLGSRSAVLVAGADEQGAMYACLDTEERIRIDSLSSLATPCHSAPAMQMRGYQFCFPTYVRGCNWDDNRDATDRLAPWFYNPNSILPLLDQLAVAKFNVLHLEGTHPFPAIASIPGYPEAVDGVDEQTPLTLDTLTNERIPYLRWLFTECHRRGITPYIGFFNAWIPDCVVDAKGIVKGPETDYPVAAIETYNRACMKAFADTYGDLAGLFIWNGEALPKSGTTADNQAQNRWLRDAVVAGLLQSSNRPPCILWTMSGFMDRPSLDSVLASYPQLRYVATDHDAENTVEPDMYSIYVDFNKGLTGVGGIKGTMVYSNLGGWGSGNIIPYPWFSNSFLYRMGQHLVDAGVVGSTSQPMRGIHYPDAHDRDWMFISGMGKFLWDSSDPHVDYFASMVKDRYGCSSEAAAAILEAFERASEIPTLFTAQFYFGVCSAKNQFGAALIHGIFGGDIHTFTPGMLLADGDTDDLPDGYIPLYVKPVPWDLQNGKLVDIVNYVKTGEQAAITPDNLANILEADANACLQQIDSAASGVTRRQQEFEELRQNIHAYHYMGMHYAEKTRALLDMLRYCKNGGQSLYNSGKVHLQNSLDDYMQLRAVSKSIYPNPDTDLLLPSPGYCVRHDWDSILPILQDEITSYDKYLQMVGKHLTVDRSGDYASPFSDPAYRTLHRSTVGVFRPWVPADPADYWLTSPR